MQSKSQPTLFARRRGVLKLLGAVFKALRPKPGRISGRIPNSDHIRRDIGLPPEAKPTLPEPPFPRI